MLDEATRIAILKLKAAGHGTRAIAKALQLARISVRRVIVSGTAVPPPIIRASSPSPGARRSWSSTRAMRAISAGCTRICSLEEPRCPTRR